MCVLKLKAMIDQSVLKKLLFWASSKNKQDVNYTIKLYI